MRANRITVFTAIMITSIAIYHLMNMMAAKIPVSPYVHFELPPVVGHTEIDAIEISLSKIFSDSSNQLVLNASTESALSRAEASLAFSNTLTSPERIQFLIRKSYIGSLGNDVSQIFFKYHEYKNQERDLDNRLSSVTEDEANTLRTIRKERKFLQERESLQIETLGDQIASGLYGRQNQLAHILIDLRAVELNTALSHDEKRLENTRLQNKINQMMQENYRE